MAITELPNPYMYPPVPTQIAGTPGFTTSQVRINGATHYVGFYCQASRDFVLDKLTFRVGTITTGCTLDVRVETESAGLPSNTLWGANTNASQVVADTDDNTSFEVTLTSNATFSKGDGFFVAFRVLSGTPSSLNISTFNDDGAEGSPFVIEYDGSATYIGGVSPVLGLSDSTDGYFYTLGLTPIDTLTTHSIDNATTPDVIGVKFQLAVDSQVTGYWAWIDNDGESTAQLLDSDGSTVLASETLGLNIPPSGGQFQLHRTFPESVNLTADTDYYLVFTPTSASNIAIYTETAKATTGNPGLLGSGKFFLATAKDPTDSTDYTISTTEVPFMGLIIDGVDVGTGGGETAHASMS